MEFWAQITEDKIIKAGYGSDHDKLNKLKPGIDYKFNVTKPRNAGLHRKMFALFNMAFENQEAYTSVDELREDLIIDAGYFDERTNQITGERYKKAHSLSYTSMDDLKFGEVYSAVLDSVLKYLDIDNETLMQNLVDFM